MWPYFILTVLAFIAKVVYYFMYTESVTRTNGVLRATLVVIYIILQILNGSTIGEMSQDFWYFVSDAIILSQICSIYVLDQPNFSIFNSFTPIMLSILSFLLILGLKINAQDKSRLCLVKTIGKHDAVFLILLYGIVVLILSTVDFFATSYYGALGAIFFLHALIIFPGLMES